MGPSSESLEDRNAGRNEDSRDPDWEVLEENKDSIRNWAKRHLCDALAKEFWLHSVHIPRTCVKF